MKSKTIKKIIHLKLTIAVFLLLPVVAVTLVTSKTDRFLGLQSFVVETGSMTPTIPVGSVVYMQKASDYHAGEIISFKNAFDLTVTHRIFGVGRDAAGNVLYKTKGDANNTPDSELIPASKVFGKNIFMLPYLGYAINFLHSLAGFVLLIIVPTLVLVCFEFWNIKKEIEKNVERKVRESIQAA